MTDVRVYKFLSTKWALDAIEKRRLKISEIEKLNDPFEFWCIEVSDPAVRAALRRARTTLSERRGLLCFSRRWRNPLLWSHYAEKHRGICLGFDVANDNPLRVRYASKRVKLRPQLNFETAETLLCTKYKAWSYEEEFRLFCSIEERDTDGNFYYPFSGGLRLAEVIAGHLNDTGDTRIEQALGEHRENVNIIKARLAFKSFRVVRDRRGFPGSD